MKIYRKSKIILIALMSCFAVMLIIVPTPFYSQAKEKIRIEMISVYEDKIKTEFDTLQQKYDNDIITYQNDLDQYHTNLDSYNAYMAEYKQAVADYETLYAADVDTYQSDLSKYKSSVSKYNQAYDNAYKNAEEATLKNGISFSVDVSCSMDYNNHVGNEWYEEFYLNGKEISYGDSITLPLGSSVQAKSICIENDSIPDVGSASGSVNVKRDYFQSGFTITQDIVVRENRGRYTGNTAGFTVVYTLIPVPYTVTVDETTLPAILDKPTKPVYNPPKTQRTKLVEPIAPTEPTMEDVGIAYPDVGQIHVFIWDVYNRCLAPRLIMTLLTVVIILAGCIIILRIHRQYLTIQEQNRVKQLEEKQLAEQRQREQEKADFYRQEIFPSLHAPLSEAVYISEEEKRVNYRFIAFLRSRDQYSVIKHHYDFIKSKEKLPYYQYTETAQIQVQEALKKSDESMVVLENLLRNYPDPLSHSCNITNAIELTKVFPFDFPPFSIECKDQLLREFLKNSKVGFLSKTSEPVFILTPCYILKYDVNELRFYLLEYEQLKMNIEEHSITVQELPPNAEILAERWTYERKDGGPDLRHTYNPKLYQIYEGIVTFAVLETRVSVKSINRSTIRTMRDSVTAFDEWRMTAKEKGGFAFLTNNCSEKYGDQVMMPSFPS